MEGRQATPRSVSGPGTLLNQCRLHKTKKHTLKPKPPAKQQLLYSPDWARSVTTAKRCLIGVTLKHTVVESNTPGRTDSVKTFVLPVRSRFASQFLTNSSCVKSPPKFAQWKESVAMRPLYTSNLSQGSKFPRFKKLVSGTKSKFLLAFVTDRCPFYGPFSRTKILNDKLSKPFERFDFFQICFFLWLTGSRLKNFENLGVC